MKKLKRIVALVTVAMFLLSFVAAPVFAADSTTTTTDTTTTPATDTTATVSTSDSGVIGADVVGTKYEAPSKKLIALDIIKGFEDGSIKPDSDVTRAQFAAIVAKELNLGDVSPSPTKFKDVPASHWASGAINLAVGKGIIVGYPDGTFKPDQNVTYAEACAMLDQMLGYAPALKGGVWPTSVISLAATEGVTKGVSLAADAKTPRGEVIEMAANALEAPIMEQDTWGSDTYYVRRSGSDIKTILSETFGIEVKNQRTNDQDTSWDDVMPVVTGTSRFDLKGLQSNEVEFSGQGVDGSSTNNLGGTYKVNSYFDPSQYMGQEVEVWVDPTTQECYYIGPSGQQTIYTDTVDSWVYDPAQAASTTDKVKLDAKDKDYDLVRGSDADATRVYINTKDEGTWSDFVSNMGGKLGSVLNDLKDADIKLVLDDNNKDVAAMIITDPYNGSSNDFVTKSGFVTTANASDETISYIDDGGDETSLDLSGDDYSIVRNGITCGIDAIQKDDVLNIMNEGGQNDQYYIIDTAKKVTGNVESVVDAGTGIAGYDVYVGGVKYDVTEECTFSDNNNDSIDIVQTDDLDNLTGKDVTLLLDCQNNIKHIMTNDSSTGSSSLYGILTKTPQSGSYDEIKVTFVNKQGVEQSTTFNYDDPDVYLADNGPVVSPPNQAFWTQNGGTYNATTNPNGAGALAADVAVTTAADNAPLAFGGKVGPFDVEHKMGHAVFFKYDVDSAGNLKEVHDMTPQTYSTGGKDYDNSDVMKTFTGDKIDAVSNKSMNLDNGSSYNITDKTVIWDAHEYNTSTNELDNVTVVPWSSLDNRTISGYVKVSGSNIDYMVITSSDKSIGSNDTFGLVKGFSKVDGDDAVQLLQADGTIKTVVWNDADPVDGAADYVYKTTTNGSDMIKKGDLIFYTLKGYGTDGQQIDKVTGVARSGLDSNPMLMTSTLYKDDATMYAELNAIHSDQIRTIKVTSASSRYIKGIPLKGDGTTDGSEGYYTVDSNTKYFDAHDTGNLQTLSTVTAGDIVVCIDTDDDGSQMDFVVKVAEY